MMLRAKQVLLMVTLALSLVAFPVFAQETGTTAAASSGAADINITTMIILAGLVAIFIVGGVIYMKEHSNKEVD